MPHYAIHLPDDIDDLLAECHAAAVRGGWWTDLETGDPIQRNKGELLCLIHSEISEGYDADLFGNADDKLRHRLGAEVELADAMIRIADYAGGFDLRLVLDAFSPQDFTDLTWAQLHSFISRAMEAERKSKPSGVALIKSAAAIALYAQIREFDLWGAVREKLAYNAQRADHKPENRRQAGGKKF